MNGVGRGGGRRQGDNGHAPPKQQRRRTSKEGGAGQKKKLLRDSRVWRYVDVAPPRDFFGASMDGDGTIIWPSKGAFQSMWNSFFAQTDPRRQLVCAPSSPPSSRALHRHTSQCTDASVVLKRQVVMCERVYCVKRRRTQASIRNY
jgi:hypothetical protein